MSRRRRRVKIKSSSRLFAFILFNLLLLASCITAHYQQADLTVAAAHPQPHLSLSHLLNQQQQQQPQHSQKLSNEPLKLISQSQKSYSAQQQLRSSTQTSQQQHQDVGDALDEAPLQQWHHNQGPPSHHHYQYAQHHNQHHHPHPNVTIPSIASLCAGLPASQVRHLKLCKLVSHAPAADEAVRRGAAQGLEQCRQQFRSERWNCTHSSGDHHLLTSKLAQSVGNRESAFVQAIAAAGIVHAIATACSTGSLSDCACDKTRVGLIRQKDQIWKWGGCSNNIRHGMMYARHLVELLDAVHEHHNHVQRSFSLIGLSSTPGQSHGSATGPQNWRHLSSSSHHHHLAKRQLISRSLSGRYRELNQHYQSDQPTSPTATQSHFCQKNQNISQTAHIQLIKSLLAKNSLERHQDFRLAMNMHNNKVGRMVSLIGRSERL